MPKFSPRSQRELSTCHWKLQAILWDAIEIVDFTVLEGHRSPEKQREAYDKGFSKVLEGTHNVLPSCGVDVAPYPLDWADERRFYLLAGVILVIAYERGIKIRWGGDWDSDGDLTDQTFNDIGHFELAKEEV